MTNTLGVVLVRGVQVRLEVWSHSGANSDDSNSHDLRELVVAFLNVTGTA